MGNRPDAGREGPALLRDAIAGFLAKSGIGARRRDADVLAAWREALGSRLVRHTRAVRFQRGELVVEVASAAHLHELSSFTGESYRRAANARLGGEHIRRVTFRLEQ
jgi:hypothetical protein